MQTVSYTISTSLILFIYLFTYLLIYLWLCWVFDAAHGLSLVAASRGYSSLQCAGLSLCGLSCYGAQALGTRASLVAALRLSSCGTQALDCAGFSSCGTWAQQLWLVCSTAQAQQLWPTGLAAPQHVGSSWTRDQTCVPCTGRRILNHCTTREVPPHLF